VEADSAKKKLKMSEKAIVVVREPDTTLVKAAIKGDPESFTELCRRYYPAMVAIAHSILGDRDLAEDAAQTAFAKAAVKLPQIKNETKFPGWLAVICRNAARDLIRRENGRQRADELSDIVTKTNAAAAIILVAVLFLGRDGRTPEIPAAGHKDVTHSETKLISMMSMRLSYQRGGFDALDRQFRDTLDVLGPWSSGISMRDLIEGTNGS